MLRNPQDEAVPALDDVFHDVDTEPMTRPNWASIWILPMDEAIDKVQDAVDKTTVLVKIFQQVEKSERSHAGKDEKKAEFSDDDGDWWLRRSFWRAVLGWDKQPVWEKSW